MSRGLTTAALNAVQAEVVARTVAVSLDFPSGISRFNGSPADIAIGGETFLGVGGLGGISATSESNELRAYDLTVELSGVPNDSVAVALTEAYQGREGVVWEVLFDRATGAVIADPVVIFRGRMDQMTVQMGQAAKVTVKLINRLADWERPKLSRYTDEEQTRLYAGDDGLKFVAATVEKELVWPAAGFWDRKR